MKNKLLGVLLVAVIFLSATLSSCKKPGVSEIDRTFEYTQSQSQPQTEATGSSEPESLTETSTEAETTTEEVTTTQKETVTQESSSVKLEGMDVYFLDKDSIFSTLPYFNYGKYDSYFSEGHVEGLKFTGTSESDFEEYLKAVLGAGVYSLNSRDGYRAYLAKGDMCITLLYKDGVTLLEAGKNYWDILTFAEQQTVEQTKPAETKDARYDLFDDKGKLSSMLPYFNYGTLAGYNVTDSRVDISFGGVSDSEADAYKELLMDYGFMFAGTLPNGSTFFTLDEYVVTMNFVGGNLDISISKN